MKKKTEELWRVEDLQMEDYKDVLLTGETEEEADIFELVHDRKQWRKWTDSSGKGDLPPDFYCASKKIMMDVMTVDDNSFIGKKGKLVNPTKACISQMKKQLDNLYGINEESNARIMCIPDTGLPTEEDHNYKFYKDNFIRVIESHKKKIANYKINHEGYKVIFLIVDESTAYMEKIIGPFAKPDTGVVRKGQIHKFFADKAFTDTFMNSEIDYVIWYAPYKLVQFSESEYFPLPRVCVFNTKNKELYTEKYCDKLMESSEM